MRVTRFNFAGTTRGVRPTPQGGLCVEAAVARTGVLQYGDGSGRTWLEYRPESEVFAADSLASLRGATVTDEHPAGLVTPETFTEVSRGHAADDVRRDGDFVVVDLLVQDAGLMALVESGERREVSCGYTCEVDPTPGVTPEGDRYDAVQRNIRHNHVALLAPGEGRSGPEVSLRMDGAAVEVRLDAAKERATVKTIRLNGRTIRLDEGEDDKKAQADVDVLQKKADDGGDALATAQGLQEKITGLLADVAMLQGQLTAAQSVPATEPTEESIPAAVADALVARRLALITDARKVLGPDVKLDGLSADAIRRLAVEKALPDQKARLDAKDAKGQASLDVQALLNARISAGRDLVLIRVSGVNGALGPALNDPAVTVQLYPFVSPLFADCADVARPNQMYAVDNRSLTIAGDLDSARVQFSGSIVNGRLRVSPTDASAAPNFLLPLPIMGSTFGLRLYRTRFRFTMGETDGTAGNLGGHEAADDLITALTTIAALMQFRDAAGPLIQGFVDIATGEPVASCAGLRGGIGIGIGFGAVRAVVAPLAVSGGVPGMCGAALATDAGAPGDVPRDVARHALDVPGDG